MAKVLLGILTISKRRWFELAVILSISLITVILLTLLEPVSLLEVVDAEIAHSFLATVAQVLAGILAIVFSLSLVAVELSSDRYTPRLFSYFARDRSTWLTLAFLLLCILISVVAIGIQTIPMYRWGFLVMSWLFALCLLMMFRYSRRILWLLDPRNLPDHILDESRQAARRGDRQSFLGTISSLGDMAVKAFERGEDEIARMCLNGLHCMQKTLVGTSQTPAFRTDDKFVATFFGLGIPSPVMDQYYRIFRRAILGKSEELTRYIVRLLSEAIIDLMGQDNREQLLRGILQQQYQRFIELAIENQDGCRFLLIRGLRDALFYDHQFHSEEYLASALQALQKANNTIIDHKDFALWKSELHDFSTIPSVRDVHNSLLRDSGELILNLARQTPPSLGQYKTWCYLESGLVQAWITPTQADLLGYLLAEFGQSISQDTSGPRDLLKRVEGSLQQLDAATRVYNAFFVASVYAFYRGQYQYIKELWQHVNPPDASASWGNTSLIHLDIGFLTHQMVSATSLHWEIEGYHGAEIYTRRYYLLCLAYALQHPATSEWFPSVPTFSPDDLGQNSEYSFLLGRCLGAVHTFLVNLPYYVDHVLAQYDDLVGRASEWDDVFRGQTTKALEKAKEWLEDTGRRQVWQERAERIVRDLPLDDRRVKAYQKAALQTYQEQSQLPLLTVSGSEPGSEPTELVGQGQIWPYTEKLKFTPIAVGKPEETPVQVGDFQAIAVIIRMETAHITNTLLSHPSIEPIEVNQLTFADTLQAVQELGEAGCEATALLVSQRQLSSTYSNEPEFRRHDTYMGNERYLVIDDHSRLRIVLINRDSDCVFIMDRKAGTWTSVKPLDVSVDECQRDPLAVQISARETISYQVTKPEAVRIIKIASLTPEQEVE